MKKQKFRPCLSAAQIEHILFLARSEKPLSSASRSVIASLCTFQVKIVNEAVSEAYETRDKESELRGLLGFSSEETNGTLSPTEKRAAAFKKYSDRPNLCSIEELELAHTYRYENNLMSKEEEADYEGKIFGTFEISED